MNKHHQQIIESIEKLAEKPQPDMEGFGRKYIGTNKPVYHLNTSEIRSIAKDFVKTCKLTTKELEGIVTSLYENGKSYEEIAIAALIVGGLPKFRQEFDINLLDNWLSHVCGWAETDVLCQMAFDPDDLLNRWSKWEKILIKFNSDENIHKRRASLVLLTKPVRKSPDPKLSELAFVNTENLKSEKHILITKAVSWILRCLIVNHEQEVGEYLNKNKDTLPKVAYREATTKLLTGKKYIRPQKNQS